jgi:hypothetical protein
MAASFVQELVNKGVGGSGTTISDTAKGNTTVGNLLVAVCVTSDSTANAVTFSDSQGNTWTKSLEAARAATGPQLSIGWCVVATGKSHTIGVDTITATLSSSVTARTLLVAEFANLLAAPLDKVSAAAGGTGSSLASGVTATTTQADELVVGGLAASFSTTGHSFTPGATYTLASSSTFVRVASGLIEYKTVAATGTVSADATTDVSADGWEAGCLTFKAAASGGGGGIGLHGMSSLGVGL